MTLAAILLRRRRLIAAVATAAIGVALVLILVHQTTYTAESTFMPEEERRESRLSGLAAQLELLRGSEGSTTSPRYYEALLESRRLLHEVATDTFELEGGSGWSPQSGTVADFYDIEWTTEAERVRRSIGRLRKSIAVDPESGTNLLHLQTTAPRPDLAVAMNRQLLRLVDQFNVRQRQTSAREQRRFVEDRLEEARRELRAAEQTLQDYLEANQAWQQAPRHQFEVRRLERQVELRQELYISLARSYDQARIDEVRNTAFITVLDHPAGSVEAKTARPLLKLLVALAVGLVVGSGLALAHHFTLIAAAARPEEVEELRRSVSGLTVWLAPLRERGAAATAAKEHGER